MDADLIFPQTGQPQGFSTLATTKWQGNPEPVIREMVQNCLDAADAADCNCVEVCFTIRRVPLVEIPGITAYREHFENAVRQREQGKQGHAEVSVIKQIRAELDSELTTVLYCRDNGIGLNHDRMKRLLTEGDTDKSHAGAGAFGIGHLTAFAASNLRYVLYAGRSQADGSAICDVSSAHAILASRQVGSKKGLGGHGYWIDSPNLFDATPCPIQVPPMLLRELDPLPSTGSVICVTGFNDFRGTTKPAMAIARVAAKNFLVAIWQGRMVVKVTDERSQTTIVVNRPELGTILAPSKNRKRAEQGGGYLSGEQAYRAWETLEHGRPLSLESGAKAHFRLLTNDGRSVTSRVQLFRNGMWITNSADALQPTFFNGYNPFDAVVVIESGQLCDLVRGAEGPEHRGLKRRRLANATASNQLLSMLRNIADEFRDQAGRVEHSEEYVPPGFAMIQDGRDEEAEVAPRYEPRPSASGEGDETNTTNTPTNVYDDPIDPPERRRRRRRKRRNRGARPKPGKRVGGRVSLRAVPGNNGKMTRLLVSWRPGNNDQDGRSYLAARVRVPSGSDETCDQPVPPKWLHIREIHNGGKIIKPGPDGFEARLPEGDQDFDIRLVDRDAIEDPNAVEVDIVRRRIQTSEKKG